MKKIKTKMTCDVCWPQFVDRQDNGCRSSLSRRNTLLPGEVVLSRMANKLYAFRNGDFNVDLGRKRGDKRFRGDRGSPTGHDDIISPGKPIPHIACSPWNSEGEGEFFKSHCEFSMLTDSYARAPWRIEFRSSSNFHRGLGNAEGSFNCSLSTCHKS